MAQCKDCIHGEICDMFAHTRTLICTDRADKMCKMFKSIVDVVPKSEVEELSGKYEDLKLKYADLQKDHDELIAWGNDKKTEVKLDFTEEEIMRSLREAGVEVSDKSISEIKAEVAREIFEEIDVLVDDWKHSRIQSIQFIAELAELKKEYAEEL